MEIDTTFGIASQALALMYFLGDTCEREPDKDFLWSTTPWYNGRERGVCVTCTALQKQIRGQKSCFSVAWFEHRNSDNICMLKWEHESDINPPVVNMDHHITLAYGDGTKWDVAHTVKYGDMAGAARWITDTFDKWCESHAPKAEAK